MRSGRKFWRFAFWMSPVQKAIAAAPACIWEHALIKKLSAHVLDDRFFTDALYHTEVMLYPGLAANLLYAAMQLVLAVCYRSVWSGALAVYYAMLAVLRVLLLKPGKQDARKETILSELHRYRRCGIILLCMTPLFASIMILVVHKNGGAKYPGITIVVMAIYSACMVAASISNLIKFKKYRRPAMSAAKAVCLIAALMSVLSLATAMNAQIGNAGSFSFRQGLIGTAGGAVCVVVLVMAIYMVVRASKQLKFLRTRKEPEASISNSFHKPQIG